MDLLNSSELQFLDSYSCQIHKLCSMARTSNGGKNVDNIASSFPAQGVCIHLLGKYFVSHSRRECDEYVSTIRVKEFQSYGLQ